VCAVINIKCLGFISKNMLQFGSVCVYIYKLLMTVTLQSCFCGDAVYFFTFPELAELKLEILDVYFILRECGNQETDSL